MGKLDYREAFRSSVLFLLDDLEYCIVIGQNQNSFAAISHSLKSLLRGLYSDFLVDNTTPDIKAQQLHSLIAVKHYPVVPKASP